MRKAHRPSSKGGAPLQASYENEVARGLSLFLHGLLAYTSPMQLVLFEPEIPPNTGNVARLCAGTKTPLQLIEPLGFKIDDKHLKRAGLDYWPSVNLTVHKNWEAFRKAQPGRLLLTSARGGMNWCDFQYMPGDLLVLGPETRGLPQEILAQSPHHLRIPVYDTVRSLNMSTAAGIMLMEGLRQTDLLAP